MSIDPLKFYDILAEKGIDFFTGVPDSLLKQFCLCIDDKVSEDRHVISANEGNAIALAAGYHLGTGKTPLVYMQNSGLGNAVNPLLSLCDPDVYSIPLIIVVGWRGEPGVKDEPQHIKQGKVQLDLIKSLDIPFSIISKDEQDIDSKITEGVERAILANRPFVFVIKKGTFSNYLAENSSDSLKIMTREKALEIMLNQFPEDVIIVSTTGKTSREIFEIREKNGESHFKDFLTVGSMGHCSSIALGIAISNPERKVVCIDGDGALIMHMGSLSTVGKLHPDNFYHILINNQVHESVGGQATSADTIDIPALVRANGYKNVLFTSDEKGLSAQVGEFIEGNGPNFLEVKVKPGSREDLGRPTVKPVDNKKAFMNYVQDK
ncbi:MAG: phosphonopyruvate decarboxylase [Candidatus Marinimicrobia bacterium]|nr:phosphonopyruvate decarboxylase [Candidatus Neomarinimicrobiota bacterium]